MSEWLREVLDWVEREYASLPDWKKTPFPHPEETRMDYLDRGDV